MTKKPYANIIDYFSANNIVPKKLQQKDSSSAVFGLEALLNGHLQLLLFYDPLNPKSSASLEIFLASLPYNEKERAKMISATARLNMALLKTNNFYARIKSNKTGEFIVLCASFPAQAPLIVFESAWTSYLSISASQKKVFSNIKKPEIPIGRVRYL